MNGFEAEERPIPDLGRRVSFFVLSPPGLGFFFKNMVGANTDECSRGIPFRPSPMDTAGEFWRWAPRTSDPSELDIPPTDDFTITPWAVTKHKNTQVDIRPGDSPAFNRIYGYVASFGPSPSGNMPNSEGYRVEVVSKLPFLYYAHTKEKNGLSHIFARVRTYASNALLTNPTAVMLGDIVCGVTAANYGGNGLANLWVWEMSGVIEWARMSPDTFVLPREFDFADSVVEWLPCLGGAGFAVDNPDENRIIGARLLPPDEDPREFVRLKRERLNKADEDAQKAGEEPPPGRQGESTLIRPRMSAPAADDLCHAHGRLRGHDSE